MPCRSPALRAVAMSFRQVLGPPRPAPPCSAKRRKRGGRKSCNAEAGSAEREALIAGPGRQQSHSQVSPGRAALVRGPGLTLRSRGAPTACHQALAGGTRYIFTGQGLVAYRCRPLTSNVRRHKRHRASHCDNPCSAHQATSKHLRPGRNCGALKPIQTNRPHGSMPIHRSLTRLVDRAVRRVSVRRTIS